MAEVVEMLPLKMHTCTNIICPTAIASHATDYKITSVILSVNAPMAAILIRS